MKSTVLTAILLLSATAALHAQLSFLPQVGFEKTSTSLNYNELSTSGMQTSFRANLKTDYRFKGGHGPYISLGTSPAPMNFAFNNSGALMEGYNAVKNSLQFRIETGYQYTSLPIQLKKKATAPATDVASQSIDENIYQRKSCGSSAPKSSCGAKQKNSKSSFASNGLTMRLQPSLGVAYIPSNNPAITETSNGFQYASAWKTAITPAMGFEFANGKQRFLTLTVFYTKPVGMNEETFTSGSSLKAVTTNISPTASTWGLTAGVPFSFVKSNGSKTKKQKRDCQRIIYRRCYKS
jgi:hypothetical protein